MIAKGSNGAGGQRDATLAAREFNLGAPPIGYFDDPAEHFRLLRDHDPMHRNGDGSVLLTRYEDVRTIWRDLSGTVEKKEFFGSRFGEGPMLDFYTDTLLFRDPPDHDRLRILINPFFTRKAVEPLRVRIDAIVDRLIDHLQQREEVDFVADFALPLPTDVICMLLGLPREDGGFLHDLSEKLLNPLNPNPAAASIAAGHAGAEAFARYLAPHLDEVRRRPKVDGSEDLICALVAASRQGHEISDREIVHTSMLMFIGGHGTTTNMLSSSLHVLLQNPDQLVGLRKKPQIPENAIGELLRYITPIQLQGRRTTRPVTVSSGEVPAQTEIILCAGAANRDERVFVQPDRLDLQRDPVPHIAFGAGVHFCVGRALAQLELSAVFPKLLHRFSKIERSGPATYRRQPRFRSLERLPLRFS
jgi:cytochrome P450